MNVYCLLTYNFSSNWWRSPTASSFWLQNLADGRDIGIWKGISLSNDDKQHSYVKIITIISQVLRHYFNSLAKKLICETRTKFEFDCLYIGQPSPFKKSGFYSVGVDHLLWYIFLENSSALWCWMFQLIVSFALVVDTLVRLFRSYHLFSSQIITLNKTTSFIITISLSTCMITLLTRKIK